MTNVPQLLARIGEDPDRLCTLAEMLDVLKKVGFPMSRAAIYKHQMHGTGPEYFIFGNYRAIYKLGDVLDWAVSRTGRSRAARRGTMNAQDRVATAA
jgi:hypothetical protein